MYALLLHMVALVHARSEFVPAGVLSYSSEPHAVTVVHALSARKVRPVEMYCDAVHTVAIAQDVSAVVVAAAV